ncbi:uncharacterized protein LOC121879561 isoform X2 [Homarus americanus]|uniref:uncharacterized protein LOC121879561 isoform X2 n=1 Tax=Homarus americanus TaxID=6706 RepID=UPI001C479B0B|nr:uncharacterized protein LOC121879561 isoform X2 [Homarus americanus]
MSQNGTLNISRDDVGEGTRVFIVKNGGSDQGNGEGQGMASLSRTPSISTSTSQHGGSVSDSGGMGNCESDNVINGMLRPGDEDVDPTSDLGADLQHIEEWLKTRSDSFSSFDFDPEIKPSEVDINDFFNLKSGVQFHVSGQDYGLVFSKDNTSDAGASTSTMLPNQFTFPDLGDSLGGTGSRRNSFTKRLETLMQVDKGLFEELLLTDPNKKYGNKKSENLPSLPGEDPSRGLFEELLLPGAQEDLARHAQELLLTVSMEKKESNTSGQVTGENESLREPVECSVPLSENTQDARSDHETSDELDLMVRNIQPIKLMSPQEIENMASRPLGFDETPIKTEVQRNRDGSSQMEEDFNFMPFVARGCEDNSTLPPDLLTSPNSEVDSKLSSILAMDASNDTLEIPSSEASDMLETLGKTPPKLERSISPGTFLVKLEPKENREAREKTLTPTNVSTSSQLITVAMPPPSTTFTNTTASFQPTVPISILNVNDIISTAITKTTTTPSSSLVTAVSCSSVVSFTTVTTTTTTASVSMAPKGLLKIPSGPVRTELKKLPIGMVQLRLAAPPPPVTSLGTALTTVTTTASPQLPRPAFILRPLITPGQQQPSQQQTTVSENLVTSKESTNAPLTFTPLKMVAVQPSNKPGTANVTITVDRKANLTTVNIVSSNNEHTVFKINTCDLVRAVSSIREPHLDPLGLTPQQLLRSAHTAHRLIQEVHQQGAARQPKGAGKDASPGPQNFEINQALQEVKAPISRMQQGQLALLRQAAAAAVSTAISTTVANTTSETCQAVTSSGMCTSIGSTIVGTTPLFTTASTSGSVMIPTTVNATVLNTVKGVVSSLTSQKVLGDTCVSPVRTEVRSSRQTTVTAAEKSHIKSEGVGVSLRPGAPPTMVSVPSVLDTLSASSLIPADLLQTSDQSPSSSAHIQSDDDLNDENPEMCTVSDEVANKALEELGIHIDSLQCEPSPQGGKRWLCPIKGCSKHFPKLSSLKVHLLSHNGIRPYKCSYENCDWAFYTWYKLKRHIETHLKRRDYVCSETNCNRRFTTVYNLNTHLRLHQRPKCWMCSLPECTQAFHTRRELEVHMKTHKDVEAPYKCGVDGCSKSYFTPNSLTSHMRSHHKEEELRCQWTGCGKKFDKPCRLKAHMRVHTGQRPFVCTFEGCNWSFQSASKLSRHQRKHTNDRKFTCPICQKSFLRSEHLKGHLLIHTGVRNFQCPIEHCNAKFTAKSSLYVHLKKHEGKTKENNNKVTYHCPIDTCDKSYNSKFNLRQHMLKNHTILTTNQMDYITLLSDKDLMMDQLLPLTAGGTSSSSVTLDSNVPSSTFSSASPSSDAQATLLSSIELINGDIDGNNIPPIIVMEGRSGAEAIDSMDVSMADTLIGTASAASGAEVEPLDMATITKDAAEDIIVSGGSARTDVLGNIIRSQRAKKRQQLNLAKKIAELGCHTSSDHSTGEGVVSFTNDVVLSASAVTMSATSHLQSALLQDDGVGSELYQESLMGHDLLSDPTTDPQSTINLRDLE